MTEKVVKLTKGKYETAQDEVLHSWHHGNFGFTLNFQLNPLRRLLFSVNYQPNRAIDRSVRSKGTLISLLKNDLRDILTGEPTRVEPYTEQGKIIFTDYYFKLDQPEFGLFEQTEIKLNGTKRQIGPNVYSVVTYFSNYEINTEFVITLVDRLVALYGADDYGFRELLLYEVELIDNAEFWRGRNWLINQHHALQNLDDPTEHTIYQVTLMADPDNRGLNLCVIGFNTLLEYDALMNAD